MIDWLARMLCRLGWCLDREVVFAKDQLILDDDAVYTQCTRCGHRRRYRF